MEMRWNGRVHACHLLVIILKDIGAAILSCIVHVRLWSLQFRSEPCEVVTIKQLQLVLDAVNFRHSAGYVCDVALAVAERLEGGWDREPSEKPGPLWILLDLQVTTEKSAPSFPFSHFVSFLDKTGGRVCHYCCAFFHSALKSNGIRELFL